jgi:hypothetical protein
MLGKPSTTGLHFHPNTDFLIILNYPSWCEGMPHVVLLFGFS